MLFRRRAAALSLTTPRLTLRPPQPDDFVAWAALRRDSAAFLQPWEPRWARDHLTDRAFRERVAWAARAIRDRRAYPFLLARRSDGALLGALTMDNIRRGPAMAATVGYWIGEAHAKQGYMTEALNEALGFAFDALDLSRLEAACLPENAASRRLLARCGFREEGRAPAYLQIAGRWRDHILCAALRGDRASDGPAGEDGALDADRPREAAG
jgi:ribosomal-protein-alanine N-acetyltransferase